MRPDVFLSYNRDDQEIVLELAKALKARKVRVWLDVWDLVPGRPWQVGLEEAIATSRCAAVLVGGSNLGPWQRQEMRAALNEFVERDASVIPVLLPGASKKPKLPIFLKGLTWVDLRDGLSDDGLGLLLRGIDFGKESPSEPCYPDDATRADSEEIEALYEKLEELRQGGADLSATQTQILTLRRKMRDRHLKAGEFLGDRYKLVERIGHGGFAEVWRATDRKSRHRTVALKVLHGQYVQDRTRKERFLRGARRMLSLREVQGIVDVLGDVPETDDLKAGDDCFFAMEYLDGGDLRAAMRGGKLDRSAALAAVLEVGEALACAHAKGLIHRDVKPTNILLTSDGRAKLTDFDLVRAADTTGGTRTQGMGSFVYAAPEVMHSAKKADQRADVFGLAMTAVFVLHGADLPMEALFETREFLDEEIETTGAVREVLARGLAKKVEKRTPTVEKLCADLRAALASPRRKPPPPEPFETGEDEYGHFMVFSVGGVEQRMRWIEPGKFMMGSPEDEPGRTGQEGPRHEEVIEQGFWLGETPCTQALWKAVMGENPSYFQSADRPVEQVSWEGCRRFFEKLEERVPGIGARFPTEAEWEYACRAGAEMATYAGPMEILGTNNAPILDEIAWYGGNSGGGFELENGVDSSGWPEKQHEHDKAGTRPVAMKTPNPWGLYDTLGNVWEWCEDRWRPRYDADPEGSNRVVRGGSWNDYARSVRAAYRDQDDPAYRYRNLGFRLARGQSALK